MTNYEADEARLHFLGDVFPEGPDPCEYEVVDMAEVCLFCGEHAVDADGECGACGATTE